jgi:spore maturation protein CgeB
VRILFSGPYRDGSITAAIANSMRALRHDVTIVDQARLLDGAGFFRKVQRHVLEGPLIWRYREALLEAAEECRPDLVFVDQAMYLSRSTVAELRRLGRRVVHYTSEYFAFYPHLYRLLGAAASTYDAHVITNELNEPWLRSRGARAIVPFEFGYDPAIHRPVPFTESDVSDIAFGGHWEPFYETVLAKLYAAGLSVRVVGPKWHRATQRVSAARPERVSVDEYQRMMSAARMGITLLSKWNRNTSGGRTFEVPAFGPMLLAEHTEQQARYYVDGREAVFFRSADEAVSLAVRYLSDERGRVEVARAGRDRLLRSGYDYESRTRVMLDHLLTRIA